MIILEGPDGSGKTTLAQELMRQHGYTYEHMGPPEPGSKTPLFRRYQAAIHHAGKRTVCDRLFHGELVYGPVLRNHSQLTDVQVAYLELEAQTRGALVVWCGAEASELVKRGDPIYQRVSPTDLLERYHQVMLQSCLPFLTYDSSWQAVSELVFQLASRHEPRDWSHRGVGDPRGVALVGDKLSGDWPERDDPAWKGSYAHFRPFDHGPSHQYLIEALLEAGVLGKVYLTNAIKQHTSVNVLKEELRGCRKVVALGNQAERVLKLHGFTNLETIPHPAYWRRFEHYDLPGYADLLKRVCK